MTNPIHLSAQLAHLGHIDPAVGQHLWATALYHLDPAACQQVWAVALRHLDPKALRALSDALPPAGAVAQSLRENLSSLALERATAPQEVR
jgi:hypothetical protein